MGVGRFAYGFGAVGIVLSTQHEDFEYRGVMICLRGR